ncbi:hypothetical protein [Variovorax boronicumulans]
MDLLDLFNHLLNFAAPAAFIAGVLVVVGRFLGGPRTGIPRGWMQWAITFGAGLLTSLAGLIVTGRDGAMTTYAALAAVCGTVQWLVMRGWGR